MDEYGLRRQIYHAEDDGEHQSSGGLVAVALDLWSLATNGTQECG